MALPAIEDYDDAKFEALFDAVNVERNRRLALTRIPEEVTRLNGQYLEADGRANGAPWKQPIGSFDAYPKDWVATDNDKTWYSEIDSNTYQPPTNWREVAEEGVVPEWVQPSGAGGYLLDDMVTFEGAVYKSIFDGKNVWSPVDYPTAWELQE